MFLHSILKKNWNYENLHWLNLHTVGFLQKLSMMHIEKRILDWWLF